MDSTIVNNAGEGLVLLKTAVVAVTALVSFIIGRVHALRKKR
jgi:hypothetical protein